MQGYLIDGTVPEYYENGKKKKEVTYKNGKRHGLWPEWYENGQLKRTVDFKDGKIHGKIITWHENGALHSECFVDVFWSY